MSSEFTGHTRDEIHDALKHKFLVERTDAALPRVRSTTSLTTRDDLAVMLLQPCQQRADHTDEHAGIRLAARFMTGSSLVQLVEEQDDRRHRFSQFQHP
jgi:hypothetical protein